MLYSQAVPHPPSASGERSARPLHHPRHRRPGALLLRSHHRSRTRSKRCTSPAERKLPLFVLGGGSNLLVSDAGFDGLVIRADRQPAAIDMDGTATNSADCITTPSPPASTGTPSSSICRAGISRHRVPRRHPRPRRRHARSRTSEPTGRRSPTTIAKVRALDLETLELRHLSPRGLRLRLPPQHLQHDPPQPLHRHRSHLPASTRTPSRTSPTPTCKRHFAGRDDTAEAHRHLPRRPRDPSPQGHAARRRRTRLPQRRLLLQKSRRSRIGA